jgi:hypothetical protein
MTKTVPIETLRRIFVYDGETGNLTWSFDEGVMPHVRGKQAFTSKGSHGYWQTNYRGIVMLAHRVIIAMETGEWPIQVDHINGDKADNRRANIRPVTQSENRKNLSLTAKNKSGVMGVSWDKVNGKWVARIKDATGRMKNLGRFKTLEEAAAVRKQSERQNGYHTNHGRITR